ncbi:MAG: sulfurtransferase [Halobacteriaceae archaeon]
MDWVVSPDWVADRLDDAAVRVVDVREAWEYEGIGHVPGAVNVPFDAFRAESHAATRDGGAGDEGMFPDSDSWAALLATAGVTPETHLVAYDDTHGVFAARFLVTALRFGHDPERLHLLDGDYSAWTREHAVSTATVDVQETDYDPGGPVDGPFVTADAVAAAVDAPDAVVVDTRSPEEYAEGHLPGAVNLDWTDLVDRESRGLKPRAELTALLDSRGVSSDRRVVLYCNTARRISHTFVVLKHLGYPDVAFYEGSLTAWTAEDRPLESGVADG